MHYFFFTFIYSFWIIKWINEFLVFRIVKKNKKKTKKKNKKKKQKKNNNNNNNKKKQKTNKQKNKKKTKNKKKKRTFFSIYHLFLFMYKVKDVMSLLIHPYITYMIIADDIIICLLFFREKKKNKNNLTFHVKRLPIHMKCRVLFFSLKIQNK